MKRVIYAACLILMVYTAGCSGRVHRPDIPRALDRRSQYVFYDVNEFNRDY